MHVHSQLDHSICRLGSLSTYRWLHFCKYHQHRHLLYLCTINSFVTCRNNLNGACICWRITTKWNAFWTNTFSKEALLHISHVNSRLHLMVFFVLTPENLRFSTSSVFLVFAFPDMCVISVLQDTHLQKDANLYLSESLNHFVFKCVTAYHLVLTAILGNTLKRSYIIMELPDVANSHLVDKFCGQILYSNFT